MSVFEIIVNIFLAVLSSYIVFEYYRAFFDVRQDKKIIIIIMSLDVMWQILSMPFILNMHQLLRLTICVVFILVVSGCFIGSALAKVMFALIFNGMNMLIELVTASVFLCIGLSLEEYSLEGSIICQLFALIIVKLLIRFFGNNGVSRISLKYSGMLMIILLGAMICAYHIFMLTTKSSDKMDFWVSMVASIVLFIDTILVFVLYIHLSERLELKRKNDIYRLSIQLCTEHLKEKEATMKEWQRMNHDFKHNLHYISELLRNADYGRLEEYITNMTELASTDKIMIVNTDNSFVDALINAKYFMAKQRNISFKARLDIPHNMPFDNADLCVVLGNALDNAIEANANGNVEYPYVDLKMVYDDGNLVIIIENSFDGDVNCDDEGNFITTKSDGENHGFGVNSIKNIIKKYNGYMDIDIENGVYKLYILLH